jgi:hypothetical protein
VVGVLLTAGFAYLAEQRKETATETADLRQASRLVDEDLLAAQITLEGFAEGWLSVEDIQRDDLDQHFPLTGWREQRSLLARYLPRSTWLALAETFDGIEVVPRELRELPLTLRHIPKPVARDLKQLYDDISRARALINERSDLGLG